MPDRLRDINLLPQYERQNSSHSILFIALIILILFSYIFIAYQYFTTKNKLNEAELVHAELSERVEQLQMELNVEESDSVAYEQAVAFVENNDLPTSTLIVELDHLLPDFSYLSEYEYGSEEVKIKTYFETLDTVANYTTNLLTSNFITDTKVDEINSIDYEESGGTHRFLVDFEHIPRYESDFTLKVNKLKLKGELREDE